MAHSVQKVVARCELAIGSAPSPEKETQEEEGQNLGSGPSSFSCSPSSASVSTTTGFGARAESENEARASASTSSSSSTQEGGKGFLDLSNCQLMQVPDAVYYMLRNTPLIECNLAFNVISKIPPKLPAKFSFIKKLNLSHNRLSALPDEIRELTQLEMVDISSNSFLSLPACLFATPKLAEIRAQKNFITDVDADAVSSSPKLEQLNLKENPLSRSTEESLSKISQINIVLTKRELEEWEDLTV